MNNTMRSLKSVVSVDGWIAKFDEEDAATVHVNVVFGEGLFGAEPHEKIRFKVVMKRAEIVVRLPVGQPTKVIQKSVAYTPNSQMLTRETTTQSNVEMSGHLGGEFSTNAATFGFGGKAAADGKRTTTEVVTEEIKRYVIEHFTTDYRAHAWKVASRDERMPLGGSPWDPLKEPRMSVRRSAERDADGDKPSLKIEVRCRRQDLHIEGLEAKDENVWRVFQLKKNRDANLAAAEQAIKDELTRAGFLNIPDISEDFAEFLVADVIITEDW
jgi:hypothetical protein